MIRGRGTLLVEDGRITTVQPSAAGKSWIQDLRKDSWDRFISPGSVRFQSVWRSQFIFCSLMNLQSSVHFQFVLQVQFVSKMPKELKFSVLLAFLKQTECAKRTERPKRTMRLMNLQYSVCFQFSFQFGWEFSLFPNKKNWKRTELGLMNLSLGLQVTLRVPNRVCLGLTRF